MENLILKGLGSSLINGDIKTVDELLQVINNLNFKKENDLFEKLNITDSRLKKFIEENLLNLKELKFDAYPTHKFYFKDDKCIMHHNLKHNEIHVNIEFLLFFGNRFNYNYNEIINLIKHVIENIYEIFPIKIYHQDAKKGFIYQVEQHYKLINK